MMTEQDGDDIWSTASDEPSPEGGDSTFSDRPGEHTAPFRSIFTWYKKYPSLRHMKKALDTPNVVQINYDLEFTLAMEMFRGIQKNRKVFPDMLAILWSILAVNPTSYTIWKYRRHILRKIFRKKNASH